MTGVTSGDIQSEIAMFIDGCNLVWATSDGLQFLSKVLLKGGRWHEVNIDCFVEFSKEIGVKLGSSIRDDFLGYSVVAVDLTYECIDDISGLVFLFHWH